MTLTVEQETEARHLVALYAERCDLAAKMAAHPNPTGAMAAEVLAKGDELDVACEAFRRKHYPRRAEVVVGLYSVMVASKTRRNVTTLLDLFDEYRTRVA